ncbi:hypothetical protein ABHA15_06595 [Clostridium perfringens]|uniref:hypothetical protein n=1 Tax=Clostridium perfringens TaxID=1502 RepID=UPI001CB0C044|nr:hypothetical protein [Clostridium perfringens]MDB2044072.1 hypothetical protein [Clostridium perfringens]MDB2053568.1 hypothetical protein [Clostridium perfringens]MDM0671216.1 hypothetical protein [Clostridium perfringens]MDM0676275.1 hypothetical protein [Clostridium perfringens]MDM0679246.1 hypothetical protein [Clostridium perfringens]
MQIRLGDRLITTRNFLKHGEEGIVTDIYKDEHKQTRVIVKIGLMNLTLYDYELDYYFVKTNNQIVFMDLSTIKGFLEENAVSSLAKISENGATVISTIINPKELLDTLLQDKDIEERSICWTELTTLKHGINMHLKILEDLEKNYNTEYVMHIN